MKSRVLALVLPVSLLLASVLATSPAAAVDVDELIAKSIEASGGLAKIQAIQTSRATGKFLAQGMEFPFVMTQMRPDRLRVEAQVMGMEMIQCFDGATGWSINPMTGSPDPQPMNDMEQKSFKLQADMDGALVDYAEKGFTVTYVGEADVEGTGCHQLKLDTGMGIVTDYFIDREYFLTIKTNTKVTIDTAEYESQAYMSDFQEIDGMMQPMSIETRQGDMVMNQIMIEKVEYGIEVDPAVFVMPAAATPGEPGKPE